MEVEQASRDASLFAMFPVNTAVASFKTVRPFQNYGDYRRGVLSRDLSAWWASAGNYCKGTLAEEFAAKFHNVKLTQAGLAVDPVFWPYVEGTLSEIAPVYWCGTSIALSTL